MDPELASRALHKPNGTWGPRGTRMGKARGLQREKRDPMIVTLAVVPNKGVGLTAGRRLILKEQSNLACADMMGSCCV